MHLWNDANKETLHPKGKSYQFFYSSIKMSTLFHTTLCLYIRVKAQYNWNYFHTRTEKNQRKIEGLYKLSVLYIQLPNVNISMEPVWKHSKYVNLPHQWNRCQNHIIFMRPREIVFMHGCIVRKQDSFPGHFHDFLFMHIQRLWMTISFLWISFYVFKKSVFTVSRWNLSI